MYDAMRAAVVPAENVRMDDAVVGGVPGIWCRPADAASDACVLFLHGRNHLLGSAQRHKSFASQIAARVGARRRLAALHACFEIRITVHSCFGSRRSFTVKTFLSIGSGPGIGIATAERFAQEGFRVVLTSRDPAKLAERAQQLRDKGYAVETKAVDAGSLASVATLIRETRTEFGAIDVLHFNSASMRSATIETQPADTFVSDLTINIGAALVATQAASCEMLKRGDGAILLTGGGFATNPHPDYLSLSIGKAGIRSLTQGLFESFKERGVHIASVTVATIVSPDSPESRGVAEAFWELYAQPRNDWKPEVTYPA